MHITSAYSCLLLAALGAEGATTLDIWLQLAVENCILSLVGGVFGIALVLVFFLIYRATRAPEVEPTPPTVLLAPVREDTSPPAQPATAPEPTA